MNNQLFIDMPSKYKHDKSFFLQGSNPVLMNKFFDYIDTNLKNIKSIKLAWYLFNNPNLLSRLVSYAKIGIIVEVISIPLDGYDSLNSANIINYPDEKNYGNFTKKELAEKVYDKCISISNELKNFEFYIFPHMYIRSNRVKKFSRGSLPYSLHLKSFIIEFNDGNGTIGLTSSNFATRDEIKDNILFLMDHSYCDFEVSNHFFKSLRQNSIEIRKFNQIKSSINFFKYPIAIFNSPKVKAHTVFTSPFYKDSLSSVNIQLSDLLKLAKNRIYICAQHIAMYERKQKGEIVPEFLDEVFRASQKGIKINFLSQTYVDPKGNSNGQRAPGNKSSFKTIMRKISSLSNASYYVNPTVHTKFIVIDDWAVITTCNFTPTEFIYLSNVKISKFDNFDNLEYEGIFSEVGQFIFVHDSNIANYLVDSFHNVANRNNTYKAK